MQEITEAFQAMKFGGATIYPLLVLAVSAVVIIIDKLYLYWRCTPASSNTDQSGQNLRLHVGKTRTGTGLARARQLLHQFLRHRTDNRDHPIWWLESRASDEA